MSRRPDAPPRTTAPRRPRRPSATAGAPARAWPRPPWGWPELVGAAQYLMPALVFLPFVVGPLRTVGRVAGFGVALLALAAVVLSGRRGVGRPSPARPWLIVAASWLVLNILHPTSNSPISAAAEAGLTIAVLSPGLWADRLAVTPRRLGRLLGLIFLACAASTAVGILQFYYPGRFDPPNLRVEQMVDSDVFASYFYETPDGRLVMRPCGLSDTPGAAAGAGSVAFLLGLGLALRGGMPWPLRLACLPLAAAGMAIMYFSQVRQGLIIAVASAMVMAGLLAMRGEVRRTLTILAAGAALFVVGLLWALRAGGEAVMGRFRALLEEGGAADVYYAHRGHFVETALTGWLPKYPVGAGLGRWGMPYAYFGRRLPAGTPGSALYAEENITAWVYQGGFVMLAVIGGALALTMLNLVRITRTTPDRDLAVLGAIVTAMCAGVLASALGYVPFVAPVGVTFWLLATSLHAADRRVRAEHRRARAAGPARAPAPAPGAPAR